MATAPFPAEGTGGLAQEASGSTPYTAADFNGPSGTRPANLPPNYVYDPTANNGQGGWSPGDPARGAPTSPDSQTQFQGGATGHPTSTYDASGKPIASAPSGVTTGEGKPVAGSPSTDALSQLTGGKVTIGGVESNVKDAYNSAKSYVGGVANPKTNDPSQSVDANNARDFASQLRDQYGNLQPGHAQQITSQFVAPQSLNQTQTNQDRATQQENISDLQGVANGTTRTAADALLQQGTDQSAKNAAGLAAEYSAQNPGAALRQGLAASNNAYATAASTAAAQKANEQATARGQIGQESGTLQGQDLQAASANQNAANQGAQFNAQQSNVTAQQNQAAALQQQQINNQQQVALGGLAANETNAPLAAQIANQQAQTQANTQKANFLGSIAGGIGAAVSDKRAKKDIKRKSLADAMAEHVHGVTYEYKPGEDDGGKHAGVLADELMKAIPGAVKPDARGMKTVDTRHVTLASAGLLAELTRRLKKLEKRSM